MPESPEPEDPLQEDSKLDIVKTQLYTECKLLLSLTSVASLAVDAFFRGAANSPVPIHEEAVT